jgi:hypothetical protein
MIANEYKFGNEIYDTVNRTIESLNKKIIPKKLDVFRKKTKLHVSGKLRVENPEDDLFFGMHLYPSKETGEINIFTTTEDKSRDIIKLLYQLTSIPENKFILAR